LGGWFTHVLWRRRIDKARGSEHFSEKKKIWCLFPLAAALLVGGCACYKIVFFTAVNELLAGQNHPGVALSLASNGQFVPINQAGSNLDGE